MNIRKIYKFALVNELTLHHNSPSISVMGAVKFNSYDCEGLLNFELFSERDGEEMPIETSFQAIKIADAPYLFFKNSKSKFAAALDNYFELPKEQNANFIPSAPWQEFAQQLRTWLIGKLYPFFVEQSKIAYTVLKMEQTVNSLHNQKM